MRVSNPLTGILLRCLSVLLTVAPGSPLMGTEKAEREEAIVIVTSAGVAAYQEVLECLSQELNRPGVVITTLQTPKSGRAEIRAFISATHPSVVIAIGSTAAELMTGVSVPVITTMTLEERQSERTEQKPLPVAHIAVDLAPDRLVGEISRLFPSRKRIAVLGEEDGSRRASILKAANSYDLTVEFVESRTPRELLAALTRISQQSDLLWCLPALNLYEPASVTALLVRSIQNRLPVIGFSEGFAKAGAAASFFPDYRDMGRQTAEAVRRYLDGRSHSSCEKPRRFRTCVNRRVIRILGIKMPDTANLEVIR